jgi:hypothetical protein
MSEKEREAHAAHRLDAFVDAAFALAVSLLVVATADPPLNLADLTYAIGRVPASAVAFAMIAVFWMGHRAFGRLTPRRDWLIQLLSLAIVFMVLVYVYPLRLLSEAAFFWISGGRLPGEGMIGSYADLGRLYVVYGLGFALLASLYAALFAYGVRKAKAFGITGKGLEEAREYAAIWLILLGSGLLSAGLAGTPLLRSAPWLPGFAYWLIPIGIWARSVLEGRRKAAAKAA